MNWLGLLAAVLVFVAGCRSLRVEGTPGAPPVPVESLPAPPPYHQGHAQP